MTYSFEGWIPRLQSALRAIRRGAGEARHRSHDRRPDPTFPCRVSLTDRAIGENVLLLNHVSHDVANPYRASHAIFVTEADEEPAEYVDEVPPVFETRVLSLRGFDKDGMMADAILTQPGEADAGIRKLFDNPEIETIHAHNATRGCFSAKIERN